MPLILPPSLARPAPLLARATSPAVPTGRGDTAALSWVVAAIPGEGARSGDGVRFVQRADGVLGVCLFDCEGHGPKAAAHAAKVHAAIESAPFGRGAGVQALEDLEQRVQASAPSDAFLAATFVEIDAARVRVANAGMPYPFVFAADGTLKGELRVNGFLLGVGYTAAEGDQIERALQPGDVVVLTSDGVADQRDIRGDDFGREGIVDAVARARDRSPAGLAASILAASVNHGAGVKESDDRSVVVLQASPKRA